MFWIAYKAAIFIGNDFGEAAGTSINDSRPRVGDTRQ
jgi:hypothetical protein